MIILGIDPGTAATGWGAIKNVKRRNSKKVFELLQYGCIRTSPLLKMPNRLLLLRDELSEIIGKFKPDSIVVERLFFNTNTKTAISVGQARGVIMLLAAEHKVEFFEYTALQAKKVLSGYGRATKIEMQEVTAKYLGVEGKIRPDDAADALAMAIFHGKFLDANNIK